MRKILPARLQQYRNWELPDVQVWFRKGRGTRDQIPNICWIIEKAREFQKNIYFCFIDYMKAFDCVDHSKLENSERDGNTRPLYLSPEKPVCGTRKQQLVADVDQWTGSKLGKEYVKAIYCHSAYLTYMQSTMAKCQAGWLKAGIKISGRNINNLRYANDTTLMAETLEELKSLLTKVQEESEKAGLKLNI